MKRLVIQEHLLQQLAELGEVLPAATQFVDEMALSRFRVNPKRLVEGGVGQLDA